MNKPIIEVKHIGKKYKITHERGKYIALRDVIANVFRKPVAFIADKTKKVVGRSNKEEFWALKDVNFNVEKGEVVGVIGHNGAGKSTLLKILSQITPPTEGEIILRGRVGSLLEVGTGFHPELSGRENIFLNGAILGMTRKEMAEKFDQIVEFAGIEKFLDTPVKFYSSGMYVRLAFSVAAHMEPDILLIDEVLAVGDAEFQKKCLGKMDEITKKDGRTILFVSHNMVAIENLCTKTVLMSGGKVKFFGNTEEAIRLYTEDVVRKADEEDLSQKKRRKGSLNTTFNKISFYNEDGEETGQVLNGSTVTVGLSYSSKSKDPLEGARVAIAFKNLSGQELFVCSTDVTNPEHFTLPASGEIRCKIPHFPLSRGTYLVTAAFYVNKQLEDFVEEAAKIDVENGDFFGTGSMFPATWEGRQVLVDHRWLI